VFVVLVVVLILEISFIHAGRIVTIENEKKATPEAYIKKDQPTAIYIEGNPEPVLRIEDLPKEFPPHIQHPEGARLSDTKFNLAFLSLDAQKIAFSCGYIHEWIGVYELESKKVHVIDWLFDTPVDHILWSPNSQYFVYTLCGPSENCEVNIIGFKERTTEPYRTSSWHSGVGNSVSIYDLRWSENSETLQFDIGKYGIKKTEQEQVKSVTLKLTRAETIEDALEVQRAEQAFWKHELSEDEQEIIDLFNADRTTRKTDTFMVNLKLSKAVKDKAEKIILSHVDTDPMSIENKLVDFMSRFGDKIYVVRERSKLDILDNIRLNDKLQTEIKDPDNIMLSLCCVEDTGRVFFYLLAYMSKYQITYFHSKSAAVRPGQRGPINNVDGINGKTNGKYVMYKFYEGTVLPFYYEGKTLITQDLQTGELLTRGKGVFRFELRYSGYGHEKRRLTIFVRNDLEEPYSLVDVFPVLGGISR
ncbi:MAG: hypothetical protein WBD28_06305, partial [Candidatus Zixiibacteriota bacterium]